MTITEIAGITLGVAIVLLIVILCIGALEPNE